MPPRIPRIAIGRPRSLQPLILPRIQNVCLICSSSRSLSRWKSQDNPAPGQHRIQARRQLSSASKSAVANSLDIASISPRQELRDALANLQKDAPGYINISRLQLALRGFEQDPGQEIIRIGILAQADGGTSLQKAKELLRLLVADPLKPEEEWERTLLAEQSGIKPILLKVGHDGAEENMIGNRLVHEINVSSPILNGHKLELLVLEMDPPKAIDRTTFTEAVLVPTMEIPTSSTGRYTPITTPVHRCLLISEGVLGAASAIAQPTGVDQDLVGTAVEVKIGTPEERARLPFPVIDIALGSEALHLFRDSIENALVYEQDWFASGLPEISEWIKSGTAPTDKEMKEPLRKLIESVINNTTAVIEADRAKQLGAALSTKVSSQTLDELRVGVAKWAERAHTELRDQLDIAFEGNRWRKLGWWKLFWRVDDVSMIATDILNQRFLTDAEKEIIFVSGCIGQAGVSPAQITNTRWAFKNVETKVPERKIGSGPGPLLLKDLLDTPQDLATINIKPHPWPLEIPVTRAYLSLETVPALQALAQKLVLQTLSTSSLATAFGGLMYLSSVSTGLYEAGAVVALGVVWSLRRMQGKWETARQFWEGEVREEGRKAVRSVEGKVGDLLNVPDHTPMVDPELEKAAEAVNRARNALMMIR